MPRRAVLFLGFLLLARPTLAQDRPPIIDAHLHAMAADAQGPPPLGMCLPVPFPAWDPSVPYGQVFMELWKDPPCEDPIWSPTTDEELLRGTIEVMERLNVFGVLSGTLDRVAAWQAAAPGRFIPGCQFRVGRDDISPDSLRTLVEGGQVEVFAEVTNQYVGIEPDDERMEPYYRARMHSALTLEPVLIRHPGLRVYVMHAGYPLLEDLLALLYAHPQVYVDTGLIVFTQSRSAFYRYLRGIVEAGFEKRVMFGSDQLIWPEAIERGIATIEEAPFLTDSQRRDILYDNAARFFRLGDDVIASQNGR